MGNKGRCDELPPKKTKKKKKKSTVTSTVAAASGLVSSQWFAPGADPYRLL